MAKPKKTPRPKAETPKGFRDYFGAEVTHRAEMLGKIAAVYHRYGFDALESRRSRRSRRWASSCPMWTAPTRACLPGRKMPRATSPATGWRCAMI